jgi:hypothetical protein
VRLWPRRRALRALLVLVGVFAVAGVLAWRNQSVLIGRFAEWYLSRVAAAERASGKVDRQRGILTTLNRQLLMPAPPDALVPELFDFVTLVSTRVATGEISLAWVAYLYTTYQRDLALQRPDGTPPRARAEVAAELDRLVRFYAIRKRPEAGGVEVGDLLGTGDDVITLEEIEEAEKSGKPIDLRTRGLK